MARSFNGTSSDHLDVANASLATTSGSFTLSAWVNAASLASEFGIIQRGFDGNNMAYLLNYNGLFLRCGFYAAGYVTANWTVTGWSTGTWVHVAGKYIVSSNDFYVYFNGVQKATTHNTTAQPTSSADLGLGYVPSLGRYLNGKLAEAAVWNAALADSEIASLAAGFSPDCMSVAPTHYWPLMGRNSPESEKMRGAGATVTGTSQADHPRIIYRSTQIVVPAASAAAAQDTPELYGRPFGSHGQQQQQQLLSF